MRISPAAPKLLFLNKNTIVLSLSYKRCMPRGSRLSCCNSFVPPWQASFLRGSKVPASLWPLKVTATSKKLTFSFSQFIEKKCPCSKSIWRRSPYDCRTWLHFAFSIVIIKSHNFQKNFYQIFDDFLISARFIPSRALACLLDHVRIWLEPRQPSLHPY